MALKTKKKTTDLSIFSYDYQCAILKLFMENSEFAMSTIEVMDQNHFTGSAELRIIAGILKEKITKLNRLLTYEDLDLYINQTVDEAITKENCLAVINQKIKHCPYELPVLENIKDEYHNFLVAMETIKLTNEIGDLNKDGANKDDVITLFNEYDRKTTFTEVVGTPVDTSSDHMLSLANDDKCVVIPTGCKALDERMGGGMRKGDFGILVAGTGIGKTCVTSGFAAYAAWMGYKVAHVILEDKPDDIDAKYAGYVLNLPVSSFRGKNATEEGKNIYRAKITSILDRYEERIGQNLMQIRAIDANQKIHRLSVRDISVRLTKLENEGFKPDLVIIDYFDRIRCSVSNVEIWRKDQIISDELNELAVNHNVAMWVPSQGNKSIQDRATKINISNMSGGSWKGFTSQIVVAMQKNLDDLSTKVTTVQILKNRYNNDFTPIAIEFDNGTCRFGNIINDDEPIYGQNGESDKIADKIHDDYSKSQKKK